MQLQEISRSEQRLAFLEQRLITQIEFIFTRQQAIAQRYSAAETQALAEGPEATRLERFYRAWTALEADCKCDGRGLFRPRAPGEVPPRVAHFRPLGDYLGAVASADLPPSAHWATLELITG